MSDGEKIPLIAYHSVNPVKYTSLEEQTNTKKSYLYKLTACNICILITILTIFLIRAGIGILYTLNQTVGIDIETLIIIVITYISLSCLIIVKIRLTRKILISKQFNIYMNKICVVFIILIVDLSLYIAYYYTLLSDNEIKQTLFILSSVSMVFASMIIGAESIYINFKIIYIRF